MKKIFKAVKFTGFGSILKLKLQVNSLKSVLKYYSITPFKIESLHQTSTLLIIIKFSDITYYM